MEKKYKAAIVADDFSSVTDCGVQFSKKGLDTAALMSLPEILPNAEVISIDSDSRPLTPALAYNSTYKIALALANAGCEHVYKSIDSTMRGNLGSEIDAMMDAFGFRKAILTPAFPHYGRQVIGGIHYLNGVPINESPIGRDPVTPVTESDVKSILEKQTGRDIRNVSLTELRKGAKACAEYARELYRDNAEILVFDCETENDLQIVSEVAYLLPDVMVCGSTGLAQYMADGWKLSVADYKDSMEPKDTRMIFAAASASPVTREQLMTLIKAGGVHPIELDIWKLRDELKDNYKDNAESIKAAGCGNEASYYTEAMTAFAAGEDIALFLDSTPEGREKLTAEALEKGVGKAELPKLIVKLMAMLVKKLADANAFGGLLMTGGDTAKAICTELGAYGMELKTEAEAGIPMGNLINCGGVTACIKAGAFGSPQAMIAAGKKIRG